MRDKIKVCQIINRFDVGGAETVAYELARKLDPARYAVSIAAPLEPAQGAFSRMRQRCQDAGITTHALGLKRFRHPWALLKLFWFFKRHDFAIVHGHNRFADVWATELGRWAGIPVRLWTRHLVYQDMNRRQLDRYRRLSRNAGAVIAVSAAVRQYCIDTEGIAADRVLTVVNGIDTERFAPLPAGERAAARAELGLTAAEQLLLFIGRLNEQKAPDGFVRLIWKLRASGLPVHGFLCGQGPLEAELRALIDGGPGGVNLLGLRDDIPRLLGAADLFVSTSRNEGLPLNVMEAMAAGTPFCAPELAQISELCREDDDLAACLYPVPSPTGEPAEELITAWAEHVTRRLADPERRARCGRAGRQIILSRFSLERMVQRHEELYEALLNGRS